MSKFFSSFHREYFEFLENWFQKNWFSKLQGKKSRGSIIFTSLGATWEALNTIRILMEVSSRKFTIMEEMIIQVALMVGINTDKWQRLFASRLLLSSYLYIVVELVCFIFIQVIVFIVVVLKINCFKNKPAYIGKPIIEFD